VRLSLVVVLLAVWIFLAVRAFQRGDATLAIVLVVAGAALTAYRLRSRR